MAQRQSHQTMPISLQRCFAVVAIPMALSLSGCVRQVEVSDGQYTLFTNWSFIKQRNTTPKKLWNLASRTGAELEAKSQDQCPDAKDCKDIQQRLEFANQAQTALAPFKSNTTKITTIRYQAVQKAANGSSEPKPERTAYCLPESFTGDTKAQLEKGIRLIQAMTAAGNTTSPLFNEMDKGVCDTFG